MKYVDIPYMGEPPTYAHEHDAGADLVATEAAFIAPGERALIPTKSSINIPPGYYGIGAPRSGLAHKHGVTLANSPGTVDCGYTGVIYVNLINNGAENFYVDAGDRIAQLIIQEYVKARYFKVDSFGATDRGPKGHGSTGITTAISKEN